MTRSSISEDAQEFLPVNGSIDQIFTQKVFEITILFGVVCPNMKLLRCFGIGLVLGGSLLGQKADTVTSTSAPAGVGVIHKRTVAAANVYHHIITAVPFTGLGTYRDPRRPMYIPSALPAASDRTGIIAFTFLPSDDGKSAIIVLGAKFFNESPGRQGLTLLHEMLHYGLNQTDEQVDATFNIQLRVGDSYSSAFSNWLSNDCPK